MPIGLRTWFVKRLVDQIKKENEAIEQASKGGGRSSSQALTPHNNPQMPYGMKYK